MVAISTKSIYVGGCPRGNAAAGFAFSGHRLPDLYPDGVAKTEKRSLFTTISRPKSIRKRDEVVCRHDTHLRAATSLPGDGAGAVDGQSPFALGTEIRNDAPYFNSLGERSADRQRRDQIALLDSHPEGTRDFEKSWVLGGSWFGARLRNMLSIGNTLLPELLPRRGLHPPGSDGCA